MKVVNDSEMLNDYRNHLSHGRDCLIDKTESLSKLFSNLEWDDNIREKVCEILNLNLVEMGKVIGTINNLIGSLSSMLSAINDYSYSMSH
ncbi:MAG: hypothetical protein K2N23_00230 [Clostridia bacterium]|nr:hypothetical protein [Clostridia bacterium]